MAYVVTAGELLEILKRFPPGSEILIAKDPLNFIPITNVNGIGFIANRTTDPPQYTRRKAGEDQTSELGVVLWPASTPILEVLASVQDPSGNAEDDEDTPIPGA